MSAIIKSALVGTFIAEISGLPPSYSSYWTIFRPSQHNKLTQLTRGIPRVLQKLFRYFSGTTIWTSFVPSFSVWPAGFFCLNETLSSGKSKMISALFKADSSL